MTETAPVLSETSRKAPFWKTAYATIGCAHFAAGDCVAVRYMHTSEKGTDWYAIDKSEHGYLSQQVAYPHHHLTRFCI